MKEQPGDSRELKDQRPSRARLSREETLRRMATFEEREEQFIASVRQGEASMTLTIEVPDELARRLEAVGIPREEACRYAVAALSEVADHADVRAWWDGLSRE